MHIKHFFALLLFIYAAIAACPTCGLIEVKLRLFIPGEVVAVEALGLPVSFFKADNRAFSYSNGTSRGTIKLNVCASAGQFDSFTPFARGCATCAIWGASRQINAVNVYHPSTLPSWMWRRKPNSPTPNPETTMTLQRTHENLDAIGKKLSSTSGQLTLIVHGINPLLVLGPAIDMKLNITFQYLPSTGEIQYKLKGVHDGFPAYELYINKQVVYTFDPRVAGTTPNALFPPEDRTVNTAFRTIARCPVMTPTPVPTAKPPTTKPPMTKPPTTKPPTTKPPTTKPPTSKPTTKPPTTKPTTTAGPVNCAEQTFSGPIDGPGDVIHTVPLVGPVAVPCFMSLSITTKKCGVDPVQVKLDDGFYIGSTVAFGDSSFNCVQQHGSVAYFALPTLPSGTSLKITHSPSIIPEGQSPNWRYEFKVRPCCVLKQRPVFV